MERKGSGTSRAEWIWIRPPRTGQAGLIPRGEVDFSEDRNRFVYFRREFELPGGALSSPLLSLIHI